MTVNSIFYAGVLIYMIGFLVMQVFGPRVGNAVRLIGSVVVIVGWLLAKGFVS